MTPTTPTTSYVVYEGNHPYILEREKKEAKKVIKWYKEGYGIQSINKKTEYLSIAQIKNTLHEAGVIKTPTTHHLSDPLQRGLIFNSIYYEYCQGKSPTILKKEYRISQPILSEAIESYPYHFQVNKEGYFREGKKKYSSLTLFDLNKAYKLFNEGYMLKGVCNEIEGANWSNLNLYYNRLLLGRLEEAYVVYQRYHGHIPYPLDSKNGGGESI